MSLQVPLSGVQLAGELQTVPLFWLWPQTALTEQFASAVQDVALLLLHLPLIATQVEFCVQLVALLFEHTPVVVQSEFWLHTVVLGLPAEQVPLVLHAASVFEVVVQVALTAPVGHVPTLVQSALAWHAPPLPPLQVPTTLHAALLTHAPVFPAKQTLVFAVQLAALVQDAPEFVLLASQVPGVQLAAVVHTVVLGALHSLGWALQSAAVAQAPCTLPLRSW